MWFKEAIESRPVRATETEEDEDRKQRGHCYDAEKCNADTFCDCPCRSCTRAKRGEGCGLYEVRG